MELKKIVAMGLLACFIGGNFIQMPSFAIQDANTKISKQKKLTKKEKKAIQDEQNKLSYVSIDWWESYNDEYLKEYIYKALSNNQDLKIATLKVEESRQMAKLQLANELPQVMVGASPVILKNQNVTNTIGTFAIPVLASYEADIFLKNRDKTRSAKKIYEASQFQEKATYIGIVGQVGAVYYNIVKLDKLIELQEQIINDKKEIYDLMKLSNEEGIVSTADLVDADKSYILACSDIIELKKAREVMLNALCVLMGETPVNSNEIKRVSYENIAVLKSIPDSISSEIITSRPDYMVAQKMLEKAGIDVRVAKKEFLPTINILGLLNFTASSVGAGMSWKSSLAGAGAAAMLPLFTGGAKVANLKINKNRYEQTLLNYQKTNLTAIQEVNDALSTLKLDNEKYMNNLKTLQMEHKNYGFLQDKYNEGIISKLDLLQNRATLLGVNKLVVSSKADCLVNQISLYKAVAGKY